MNNKCVNNGSSVDFCNGLSNCLNKGLGDFEVKLMCRMSDMAEKHILTVGRFKKSKVQLAYCPACGVDIRTDYEVVNENPH